MDEMTQAQADLASRDRQIFNLEGTVARLQQSLHIALFVQWYLAAIIVWSMVFSRLSAGTLLAIALSFPPLWLLAKRAALRS